MSIDQRIRDGLRTTNDQLPAPDIDRALAAVTADAGRTQRRTRIALAAAAAVVAVVLGVLAVLRDVDGSPQPIDPPTPTQTPTGKESDAETIPTGQSEEFAVQVGPRALRVSGDRVPGRWQLTDARRDVWVAARTRHG